MLLAFRDRTGRVRYIESGEVSLEDQASLRAIISLETNLEAQSAIVAVIKGNKIK